MTATGIGGSKTEAKLKDRRTITLLLLGAASHHPHFPDEAHGGTEQGDSRNSVTSAPL